MLAKEYIVKKLDLVANKYTYKCDLNDVLFFYVSPMTHCLEMRSGYFEDYYEASEFASYLVDKYNGVIETANIEFPFVCYLNGRTFSQNDPEEVANCECHLKL